MRRLIPKTRMGAFTLVLIVAWLLKALALRPAVRQALPSALALVLDSLPFLLVVPAVYYAWTFSSLVRRRLVWKIRRRLVLAHTFIGLIPVLLVIVILWISALLFYYQYTYYLIVNQIGIHAAQLHAFNLSLSSGLRQAASGAALGAGLKSLIDQDSKYLLGAYPSASIVLCVQGSTDSSRMVFGSGNLRLTMLADYQDPPRWIEGREFSGLVTEDLQPEIYAHGGQPPAGAGGRGLFLRSLVAGELRPGLYYSVESSVPFDGYLLDRLKAATGQDLLLANYVPSTGLSVMLQDASNLGDRLISSTFESSSAGEPANRPVWSILLYPVSWATGVEAERVESETLFVELSTARLLQNVFRSESNVSQTILDVLRIVVGFFLAAEIISLLVGVLLTKSITTAVHNLYRGTEFIRRGDFSHRIVVKSDDQLGALARSFNQMTEYVQTLVKERVQKERLERELEIAKEVQEQLFPRRAPSMEGIEITGLCLPARVVSGDYYDFLRFDHNSLGLALGDICGKGISAALLMANLQATLRSNIMSLSRTSDMTSVVGAERRVAQIISVINEQIFHYTAANKFASLFYAVYDEPGHTLSYCNAGHNPPLYFNGDGCRRLETGGTVVGIFPDAEYEQETVQLQPGDLFLAYTDGIVECVNEYGEEFGEQRLIRLAQEHRQLSAAELQKVLVAQVLEWTFEEERDDDMTMIIAKVR